MTKIPPLITVDDPGLQQVAYAQGALYVRYNDGRLVRYPGVTVEQFQRLGKSRSMLRYLREAILLGIKGETVEEA